MNPLAKSRLVIVDKEGAASDTLDIFDADTAELLFTSSEPELDGISKVLRVLGGRYAHMSAVDYSIREAAFGKPLLRVFRPGKMIGTVPPFEAYDGTGAVIARFNKYYDGKANTWWFSNGKKEKRFDLSVKQRGGFAFSVKSLAYDILINGVPAASLMPYKQEGIKKFAGKRIRLFELADSPELSPTNRLLLLGVGASLDRIVQHRHG